MKDSLPRRLVREFTEKGLTVTAAESCTGGMIAKAITDVSGSSSVLECSFVTYSNRAKAEILGVDAAIFDRDTEVGYPCAEAMAQGALARAGADVAIATTGFAGPTGGNDRDPVGTVYIAVATKKCTVSERFSAPLRANRAAVRSHATHRAFELALRVVQDPDSI